MFWWVLIETIRPTLWLCTCIASNRSDGLLLFGQWGDRPGASHWNILSTPLYWRCVRSTCDNVCGHCLNTIGMLWPIESLPTFLQIFSKLFPVFFPSQGIRSIMIRGCHWSVVCITWSLLWYVCVLDYDWLVSHYPANLVGAYISYIVNLHWLGHLGKPSSSTHRTGHLWLITNHP